MKMFLMAVCAAAMLFVGSATAEAGGPRFVRLANGQVVRVQNDRARFRRGQVVRVNGQAFVVCDAREADTFVNINGQSVPVQRLNNGRGFQNQRSFRSFRGSRQPQVTVIQQRRSIFDFFIPRRQVIVVR